MADLFEKINLSSEVIDLKATTPNLLAQLERGMTSYQPAELFTYGDRCVKAGLYTERDQVYEAIKNHPHSTAEDLKVVEINSLMKERRSGNFVEALAGLSAIEPVLDIRIECKRLQEIQLAAYYLWEKNQSIDTPTAGAYQKKSQEAGDSIIQNEKFNTLPLNEQALYLQAVSGLRVSFGIIDQKFEQIMKQYEHVLDLLEPADRKHHEAQLAHNKGLVYKQNGQDRLALESFLTSYDLSEGTYNKTPAAFNALLICKKSSDLEAKHPRFEELKDFALTCFADLGADQIAQHLSLFDKYAGGNKDFNAALLSIKRYHGID